MKRRNEEARGVLQMNRTPGGASALSGRPGRQNDKRRPSRTQEKALLRKAVP